MSSSIRNSNLFAAEDYKKVFKAFSFIDYTAYDFDTLKQALINYIQTYYPEDFNDYIESSEFIAIIELLAYFGTSLAFRTDLNSRENFIDTAERRESIIRLAQMVNYVPKRNIAASGLFKIDAVQTNQPLTDANGVSINDTTIFWNDPNNTDWFDQFLQICNAAFSSLNPFGRPTKSGTIGSIPTDLYQLNNILQQNVTFPTSININGQQYPIDICNPDFVTNQTIFERDPDPNNAFNFIYRNDSLGVASPNTGFFLYFKQGNLINVDANFEFPVPNRVYPIDIQNINQDDVYVQQTDEQGNVLAKWLKVPALAGENIIYNSINFAQRNIFDVLSGAFDTISIRFADGNFGNVPTGLFRTWVRVSANQALVIRPDNAQGLQISIPYIGSDQQQYTLRVIFSLQQTIGNAAPTETNEQIKLRAPEVFSTQSRMVNGSDYNVLPLIYGNQIAKIQALDRTYSGQSRYIDLNDPTGFHRDLIIFGEDGAIYRDNQNVFVEVIQDSSNSGTIESILLNTIQSVIRDPRLYAFYLDEYLPQFEETIRVNPTMDVPGGYSLLDLTNPSQNPLFWKTSPSRYLNDTGYFINDKSSTTAIPLINTLNPYNQTGGVYQPYEFINTGAAVQFASSTRSSPSTTGTIDTNTISASPIQNVIQNGIPAIVNPLNPYADIGPVELGSEQVNYYQAIKVYPVFRTQLNSAEIAAITASIEAGVSFWMSYDLLTDEWACLTAAVSGLTDQSQQPFVYAPPIVDMTGTQIYSNWTDQSINGLPTSNSANCLVYVSITSNIQQGTTTFDITARGRVYVFESYRDVRFYWEPNQVVIDNSTGLALQDTIEIMPYVNTNSTVDNNLPGSSVYSNLIPGIIQDQKTFIEFPVDFNITGIFIQADGYQDTSKVEVSLVDNNDDGIPDDPSGFDEIVSPDDRIVYEYFNNEVTGYQSSRPWIANWNITLGGVTGSNLYVYFPVNPADTTGQTLYGAPFISDMIVSDPLNPTATSGAIIVFMDTADLIFINNSTQIDFNYVTLVNSISNQVTAFFNGPTSADIIAYPWLAGTQTVINKTDIVNNYFTSKSFLLQSVSPPGYGIYDILEFTTSANLLNYPTGNIIVSATDTSHFDKNGKSFTQNTSVTLNQQQPLYFKWSHYSPVDQRVDPSPTNIIDMIVITDSYYRDVTVWKTANGSLASYPLPPTTEDLRIQFQNLDQYKMVSDSMIWNSGTFKILFGPQAAPELQATFKVVKSSSSSISDNEVKTQVVQAIDTYFDIRNWDFGEKFFYTELAAFIHQQLSKIISSIVIVPNSSGSQFGNLFEIIANPTELFLSTASVNNVSIVANLTDQNLRT